MRRRVCFGIAVAILVALAVACNDSGTEPEQVQLTSTQSDCQPLPDVGGRPADGTVHEHRSSLPSSQSPCLDGGWSVQSPGRLSSGIRFAASRDTLFVYHDSAWYNCCSKIRFDAEMEGSVVDFIEVDTATSPCNCMCYFNLESHLDGLSRGTYAVRLWTEQRDSLLGESDVFIPGPSPIWFEDRCETLTVHHDNRSANCCAKLIFTLQQHGNVLMFTESDTSSILCRCMNCYFDIAAQVSGLTAGEYIVRVQDSTGGSLIDTAVIEIAPCPPQ